MSDRVERALEQFRVALRRKGLRHSDVRDEVARAALTYPGHFEAADLHRALRDAGVRNAHLATVYRTLPLLVETGLLQPTLLSTGGRQLYEAAFEREHHDHLVCTSCGKVVEFEYEPFEAMQRQVAEAYGFELTDHVHELLGRCPECRANATAP